VQEEWFEVDRNGISHSGVCVCPVPDQVSGFRRDGERNLTKRCFYITAQSEEAPTRKHVASLDERLEMLSQKLARELSLTRLKWHVPRIAPHAIERIALSNGLTSRITNTANLAARAIQRLPV